MTRTTVFDYTDILTSLRQLAPEAHIAGGAVRDTILKRPICDIDVFLDDAALETAAARLRSAYGYVKVGEWQQYLGFSDPVMTRLAKFERADAAIPLCLIGLQGDYVTVEDNLSRFDFGICMAAFDGKTVTRAAAFNDDAETQTFTLLRADNIEQFAYSMSRFKKITADRYIGWTLAVPKEFEPLATQHTMRKEWYWSDELYHGKQVMCPKDR